MFPRRKDPLAPDEPNAAAEHPVLYKPESVILLDVTSLLKVECELVCQRMGLGNPKHQGTAFAVRLFSTNLTGAYHNWLEA